jgi:hypothetical protein
MKKEDMKKVNMKNGNEVARVCETPMAKMKVHPGIDMEAGKKKVSSGDFMASGKSQGVKRKSNG